MKYEKRGYLLTRAISKMLFVFAFEHGEGSMMARVAVSEFWFPLIQFSNRCK